MLKIKLWRHENVVVGKVVAWKGKLSRNYPHTLLANISTQYLSHLYIGKGEAMYNLTWLVVSTNKSRCFVGEYPTTERAITAIRDIRALVKKHNKLKIK